MHSLPKLYLMTVFVIFHLIAITSLLASYFGIFFTITSCKTNSMTPYIDCNDILLKEFFPSTIVLTTDGEFIDLGKILSEYENLLKDKIKEGDVISYKYLKPYNIVHRVVDECDYGFITKGDNNEIDDGCIPYWAIYSKVVYRIKIPPN